MVNIAKYIRHIMPQKHFFSEEMTKYDKQDQQRKAAFNERNPHMNQWQGAQGNLDETYKPYYV
jgi:hypothetical protein